MNMKEFEQKMEDKEVAETILKQIGKYNLARLGAENFTFGHNEVKFTVKTSYDFNKVIIKYDYGNDLYDVELWYSKLLLKEPYIHNKLIDEYKGVFCEELSGLLLREAIH